MPTYVTGTGDKIQIIDKTRPIAEEDFVCCWSGDKPPHTIAKGQQYVRVVYKLKGKFESDHICLDCWCGVPE